MSKPTVGDLLAAADRDARRLLGHAEPSDGPCLAAGYAGVLHAASGVLAAIPNPTVGPQLAQGYGDYLSVRVTQMIGHVGFFKPLQVDQHPGATRIADTWQQAATLIRRHARPGLARDPQARDDAAAARVRVARTLAAVAHVTGRELGGYARQVQHSERPGARTPARAVPLSVVATWIRMTQRQEQLMLDYLSGRLSRLADERRGNHPDSGVALPAHLASWSTLANRRTAEPAVSSSDLHHIAQTQNVVLNAAGALAGAALARGELAAETGPHLLRRLDAAATQWAAVATAWTWARTPDTPRADAATISESAALIGAINQATRTGTFAWASPDDVADRLANARAVPILAMITENCDALAEIYQQLPQDLHTADRLRAPAATLLAFANEDHTAANANTWQPPPVGGGPSLHALPVSMSDVARNRLLPLTAGARQRLDTAGSQLATTAQRAHQALLAAVPSRPDPPNTTLSTARHRPPARPEQHHTHRPTSGPDLTP